MSLDPDNVTAVLVTRGDVNLTPITTTLPFRNILVWDNSTRVIDAKVFGRYLALELVTTPVVFFQDDDCVVPEAAIQALLDAYEPGVLVGNAEDNPERLAKYHDTTLLGWGSLFDRDLPRKAFDVYARHHPIDWEFLFGFPGCEIVFPMLTPTRTVTAGFEWLHQDGQPVFRRQNRNWLQPGFYQQLDFWLARARAVRDRIKTGA